MRCPRCGYDFNSAISEVGFHKCDYHPDMIYICDGCKREVHHAYKEKQDWIEPRGIKIPFQKEYIYLCLDCMREYGHYHDLLECDQRMSTEQGENLWKEEKCLYKRK